jgi:hypothetical protein
MGLVLAAMAVLAVLMAIWVAASIGNQVRAPDAGGTAVTQSSGGPLGLGVVDQR